MVFLYYTKSNAIVAYIREEEICGLLHSFSLVCSIYTLLSKRLLCQKTKQNKRLPIFSYHQDNRKGILKALALLPNVNKYNIIMHKYYTRVNPNPVLLIREGICRESLSPAINITKETEDLRFKRNVAIRQVHMRSTKKTIQTI